LTDAQVQSLQAIQQQQRQANTAAHQEMQTKQRALREAIAAGSTDAAAVGKLLLDIEATRKRIENSRGGYVDQAKNVLTAEQRTKLQALEAAQQLFDEAHQAVALNLLAAPMPGGGMGMGPALRLGGPAGRGMGPGGRGGPGRFRR
jgi:hypothetical protein